jgi:transcriptional regulator with XRE-family HTH domain
MAATAPDVDVTVIAARIRAAMELRGMGPLALAGKAGIPKTTLYQWIGGAKGEIEPAAATAVGLATIARALGVPGDFLLGLTDSPDGDAPGRPAAAAPEKADDHHLPKVAFAAAGSPVHDVIRKDDTVWYAFHRSWITRKAGRTAPEDEERLIVVQVDKKHLGESMIPTVRPGALLVVDRGPRGQGIASAAELKANRLYLVNIDGGLTVKRVLHTGEKDGMLMLASDNPDRNAYPPRVVRLGRTPLQKVVIGRVIWIGHEEE